MPKSIHLSGVSDGLYFALRDRLIRVGANVVEEPKEADFTVSVGADQKTDLAILPYGASHHDSSMAVILSDVIVPNGKREWDNGVILDWIDMVKRGELLNQNEDPRFWVNARDVVDALSVICLSEGTSSLTGQVRMSGRRAWISEDVYDEIRILWERYVNAVNHSHTVDSLSGTPSPVRGIDVEKPDSPDLGPLHQVLTEISGEGWHPLVPLRTSLMELIASSE
tara:strand:+ start:1160 stop:1831 length:672 start_codon:yes stop_codon:yes gene_type:complete